MCRRSEIRLHPEEPAADLATAFGTAGLDGPYLLVANGDGVHSTRLFADSGVDVAGMLTHCQSGCPVGPAGWPPAVGRPAGAGSRAGVPGTGTGSSANTVNVIFRSSRNVVIDNEIDHRDIKTSADQQIKQHTLSDT